MALRDYLQMLWTHRWIILLLTVIATLFAVTILPRTSPLYEATTLVRVRNLTITASAEQPVSVTEPTVASALEVETARSPEAASETIGELGRGTAEDLLDRFSVTPQVGSTLLRLTLVGEGREVTGELAAYVQNYLELREEQDREQIQQAVTEVEERMAEVEPRLVTLSERLARERETTGATAETTTKYTAAGDLYTRYVGLVEQIQLDAALAGNSVEEVGSPTTTRVSGIVSDRLRLLAGPLVGLLLGCAVALGVGVLRPRVSTREQVEERLGHPVLATIPQLKLPQGNRKTLDLRRLPGRAAEGVRVLRTELQLIEERGERANVIVIVSPQPLDGRTTVATSLASSYAAAGRDSVLVRPLHEQRNDGAADSAGGLAASARRQDGNGFVEVPLEPALLDEETGTDRPMPVIRKLADTHDIVIIDTFPLLESADALLLASEADVVLVVVRQGRTLEDSAAEGLELLTRHRLPILGIVLNGATATRSSRNLHLRDGDQRDRQRRGRVERLPAAPAQRVGR